MRGVWANSTHGRKKRREKKPALSMEERGKCQGADLTDGFRNQTKDRWATVIGGKRSNWSLFSPEMKQKKIMLCPEAAENRNLELREKKKKK